MMDDRYALTVVTPAPYEPLSLEEVKLHLGREDSFTAHDGMINGLIRAARGFAEDYTGRSLVQKTFDVSYEYFPTSRYVTFPRSPLLAVDSVTYVDGGGTVQTIVADDYRVEVGVEPGYIVPAYGKYWPAVRSENFPVTVRFTAGYPVGSPQDAAAYREHIPDEIKCAIKMLIGHLYVHRESVSEVGAITLQEVPQGALWLLAPFRLSMF